MDPASKQEDQIEIIYDDFKPEKSTDGRVHLYNRNLTDLEHDTLYHLALDTKQHDLVGMFGDVKFVCMGGTAKRMRQFAQLVAKELYQYSDDSDNYRQSLIDLAKDSDRYSMFKVGQVIAVSHGMGIPSLSILLHELIKLMHYAKCTNVQFFRIGTSGGVGVEPGTIILTNQACDELFRPYCEWHIMGKIVRRPVEFDQDLIEKLKQLAQSPGYPFRAIVGKTMCAMDFYETQSRLDGAYCTYTERDKQKRLREIHQAGFVNIEMEATVFGSMCRLAGIPGAIVNVTLVNRLNGDQIRESKETLTEFQQRPQRLVLDYIKHQLHSDKNGI